MKSSLKRSIGEVVTDYGTKVMKVMKKRLQRSLFDFYGDVKADNLRTREAVNAPTTPVDGDGGIIYTKSADGKLYYKSNEVSEVELSASDTVLTSEQVQDIVGAMVDGGTETNIAVTYDDSGGKLNFVSTDTNTVYSEATGSAEGLMSIAHHDKLDGIESSADVTDATNVTAAGALMDSELTDLAGVKGVTISTLQVKPSEGAFVNGDKTKLDGIAANATVDQTNVTGSSGSCTGNAATATALATARAINGVDFNGTAPITVTAAGSTLSDTVPVSKGGTGVTTLTSNALLTGNGTSAIQAESDLTFSGGTLTLTDSDTSKPNIQIKSTGGFAHIGGSLDFITDEGDAGASGDVLGKVRFIGDNADQDVPQQTYAQIQGKVDVATDGEESGILELQVANHDDDLETGLTLTGGSQNAEIDVTVGLGTSSVTTIAGTLTTGSTAALDNSGLIQVAETRLEIGFGI